MLRERAEWQQAPGQAVARILVLILYSTCEILKCSAGRVLPSVILSRHLLQSALAPAPAPASAPSTSLNTSSPSDGSPSIQSLWWIFLLVAASIVSVMFVCILSSGKGLGWRLGKDASPYSRSPWKTGLSLTMHKRLKGYAITEIPMNTREELELECEEFSNIIEYSQDSVTYKGTRDSGAQIAVTRITIPPSRWTSHCELQFLRRIKDLAKLKHPNTVNLLAYCSEDEPFERMMVFEYAPNGSVYDHLHNLGSPADHLDWPTRMKILMGAAYGLNYMHNDMEPSVTHRKFDSSCIYLTESFTAKVRASGMSKLALQTRSLGRRESCRGLVKSAGLEEWEKYCHLPRLENNVLSFGIFTLEIISGRIPYHEAEGSILDWASDSLSSNEKLSKLVDLSLASHNQVELVALCEVIRQCVECKPAKRPTMGRVVEMLSSALKITPDDASLGSSGKIDYKSSPLMWAKLELMCDSPIGSGNEDQSEQNSQELTTFPLLSGVLSPQRCSSDPCPASPARTGDQPNQPEETAISISCSQHQQSDSFER